MSDEDHDAYCAILIALKAHADKLIAQAKLTPDAEDEVRQLLNENMRYWK